MISLKIEVPEGTTAWLPEIAGKGYGTFWNSKHRYRVVKGSRASKKSTTIALNLICRLMEYPLSNALVLRKTAATLKDSCYAQLKWAINRLGVREYWKWRVNPLELEYLPTGQRIIFRGLDDAMKITSITVARGHLNFAWLEEAYECDEEDFNRVDESLRGKLPEGYFIQWSISFNPWSASSWLKARFFDKQSANVLTLTTTYLCNEWLSDADRELFEEMKKNDPQRYKVAGEGEWGVEGGQFFREFEESKHVVRAFDVPREWLRFRAMDWGSARPYCCLWFAVDYDGNLYCYRELYGWGGKANVGTGETAAQVGKKIAGVTGPTIAEELNAELNKAWLVTFGKSSKGRVEGANALKQRLIGNRQASGEYKPAIYFFANCINLLRTLPMLSHDKNNPETYDTTGEDHAVDAPVYGCLSRPWTPSKPKVATPQDGYVSEAKKSVWTY